MNINLSKIFVEMGIVNEFDNNTKLAELKIDSLRVLEMIARIEEEYKISIDDMDLLGENFETIGTVMKMLEKYF